MLLLVVDGYRKKVVVEIFDADVCNTAYRLDLDRLTK
jgi:hypothetical protein